MKQLKKKNTPESGIIHYWKKYGYFGCITGFLFVVVASIQRGFLRTVSIVLAVVCFLIFLVYLILCVSPVIKTAFQSGESSRLSKKRWKELEKEMVYTQGYIDRIVVRGKNLVRCDYDIIELDPKNLPDSQTDYLGEDILEEGSSGYDVIDCYGYYMNGKGEKVRFCMDNIEYPCEKERPEIVGVKYHPIYENIQNFTLVFRDNSGGRCDTGNQ